MDGRADGLPAGRGVIRFRRGRPGGGRWSPFWIDIFSIEASFVLFLFAGRYKTFAELRGFPVDFTLFFFALTAGLVAWAVVSGRIKTVALNTQALLMLLFSALATVSVFWSSLDPINIEKAARFLALTSTSFFAAYLVAASRERRDRLIRNVVYVSVAIVLYYFWYRYVLGIDAQAGDASVLPGEANTYLEYGEHAGFVVAACLTLGVFGTSRQFPAAVAGACLGWLALLLMGGRGPLALSIIVVPMLAGGLWVRGDVNRRMPRLAMLLGIVIGIAALGYATVLRVDGTVDPQQFHTLERLQDQLSGDETRSVDMRKVGQDFAFSQWLERPILGWGIGEFEIQRPELRWPHNIVLEIAMENGVIATFLFLGLAGASALACVRLIRAPSTQWTDVAIALWVLTELISHFTAEGYLADDRIIFAFMGVVLAPRLAWKRL